MKKTLTALSLLALVGCQQTPTTETQTTTDAAAPYEATWESLSNHQEVPQWLQDAKLGIYFHWGVYTVPKDSHTWYSFYMYRPGNKYYKNHQANYGKDFNYHDFIKDFTGEHFDPEDWAQLFKASGARFAGPCVIHHDGFAMWDSEVNPWNAADMGIKRDITGELMAELKKEGLKTIATFHHSRTPQRNAENPKEWVSGGKPDAGYNSHYAYDPSLVTSTTDPKLSKLYGNLPTEKERNDYWFAQIKEVVDQYSPDMIWFDSWFNLIPENYRQEMAAYYYNEAAAKKQAVTIGYKQADLPLEVGINDIEQGGKMELSERVWMTDVTLGNSSWSYLEGQTYKKPELVLRNMIDVWSKNGVVLLNISPTAQGVIPQAQRDVLLSIGGWLEKYGEAIYGTHPHITNGFGNAKTSEGTHGGQSATTEYSASDVRFTLSKDNKALYVIFLGTPTPGEVINLRMLAPQRYPAPSAVKRITLLGTDVEAPFDINFNSCTMTIPNAPMDSMATVFKMELE